MKGEGKLRFESFPSQLIDIDGYVRQKLCFDIAIYNTPF